MTQVENQPAWSTVQELELVYKSKYKMSLRPVIKSSKDIYDILIQSWDKNKIELQEQFKAVLVNRANRIIGIIELSTGGVTGTVADPKLIFGAALKANACCLIISHNHPSGNLKPSRADEELTQKIKYCASFFDMMLLDHIVLSPEGYYSFADEGML